MSFNPMIIKSLSVSKQFLKISKQMSYHIEVTDVFDLSMTVFMQFLTILGYLLKPR